MAHAIEVAGLTKRFGPVLAVDDLSFTVDEGRVVGFLGPNGAGKTTTLRMLLGLVNPTRGTRDGARAAVHDAERPRAHGRRRARRRDAAPGPQRAATTCARSRGRPGSADAARGRAAGAGRALGRGQPARGRLLARHAPAARPRGGAARRPARSLVLDEPANGLDPQGIRWLRDFLRAARRARAARCSSPATCWPRSAQTADDVVVISQGPQRRAGAAGRRSWPRGRRRRRAGRRPGRAQARRHPLRAGRAASAATPTQITVARPHRRADRPPDRRAPDRDLRARPGRRVASRTSTSSSPAARREARHDPRSSPPSCSSCAPRGRSTRSIGIVARRSCCCRRSRSARSRTSATATGRSRSCCSSSAASCRRSRCVIGVLAVTTEFRHGTITPTPARRPEPRAG